MLPPCRLLLEAGLTAVFAAGVLPEQIRLYCGPSLPQVPGASDLLEHI